jgi:hypothetical protein
MHLPFLLPLLLLAGGVRAAGPATLLLRGENLARQRELTQAGAGSTAEPLRQLRREADKFLRLEPYSVTTKQHPQPGLDPHDYVSLSRYGWPDPARPNGLPYVNRDGEPNPECKEYDSLTWGRMQRAVHNLAQAWYFSGEEKYAAGAARQLRVWFLDAATRMNPHLKHAQMLKGHDLGRASGIIDFHELPQLLDDILLLHGAPGWSAADEQQLQAWFRELLTWLRTSPNGRKEAEACNNHGCWYDAQTAALALFIGDRAQAHEILESVKTRRIAAQIEPDGRQPRELGRTLSVNYTLFNLQALFTLARLGEQVGVELWHYRTQDGRSLRAAFDWVLPYALGSKGWEHKQISKENFSPLANLLRLAAAAYQEPAYEQALARLAVAGDEKMWTDFYSPAAKK